MFIVLPGAKISIIYYTKCRNDAHRVVGFPGGLNSLADYIDAEFFFFFITF